jgi:peptide deformylase
LLLRIFKYPEAILRKRALPVEKISEDIIKLVDNMIETMLKEDGLGLAANQVGSTARIFVLNTTPHEDEPTPEVLINPEIINHEGRVHEEEGCLSFPELFLKIIRYERVRLHAKNLYNEDIVYETNGLMARAVQHEIDHLDGIVFIDRADKEDDPKVQEYLAKLDNTEKD